MRLTIAALLVGLLVAASWWTDVGHTHAQGRTPAGTSHTGDAFRFNGLVMLARSPRIAFG